MQKQFGNITLPGLTNGQPDPSRRRPGATPREDQTPPGHTGMCAHAHICSFCRSIKWHKNATCNCHARMERYTAQSAIVLWCVHAFPLLFLCCNWTVHTAIRLASNIPLAHRAGLFTWCLLVCLGVSSCTGFALLLLQFTTYSPFPIPHRPK